MPICGGTSENVFSPFTYLVNQTGVYDKWTWGFIKRNIDGFGVSKKLELLEKHDVRMVFENHKKSLIQHYEFTF